MSERNFKAVRVAAENGVATVEMYSPQTRNALSQVMVNELIYAFDDAFADASVRAIVLRGADGNFSSGADLRSMSTGSDLPMRGEFPDLLQRMMHAEKPIVAEVSGIAMGGALGLIAASHVAFVGSSARLGLPEIRRGLFPFMILVPLSRVVTPRALTRWVLTGQEISTTDAQQAGLVSEIVEAEKLSTHAASYANLLSTQSATAVAAGLRAQISLYEVDTKTVLERMKVNLGGLLATPDAQEGVRAFLEKRVPVWPSHQS